MAAIKQTLWAATPLCLCACIGTQPCAPADMHSHTHQLRKARKTVHDLSDPQREM